MIKLTEYISVEEFKRLLTSQLPKNIAESILSLDIKFYDDYDDVIGNNRVSIAVETLWFSGSWGWTIDKNELTPAELRKCLRHWRTCLRVDLMKTYW